jgi:hypothetical protein
MLLVWVGTTVGLCLGLPSCSADSMAAIRAVPIKACYIDKAGNSVCYSSKSGIEATVDQRSSK